MLEFYSFFDFSRKLSALWEKCKGSFMKEIKFTTEMVFFTKTVDLIVFEKNPTKHGNLKFPC